MEKNNKKVLLLGNNVIDFISITSREDLEKVKSNDLIANTDSKTVYCDLLITQKNVDRISRTIKHSKTQDVRQNMIDTYLASKIIKKILDKVKIKKFDENHKEVTFDLIKAGIHTFENVNYSGAKVYTEFRAVEVLSEILKKHNIELSIYLAVQDEEIIKGIINNLKAYDYGKVRIITNSEKQAKFLEIANDYVEQQI